jgi:signal recognition particle receptor subunit beta
MINYNKLLFAGPFGAGKTTAIRAISNSAPISTGTPISTGPEGEKTTTTVAMDYSFINMEGTTVHVYGMPGQDRLAFMRGILMEGAIGAILLLDAAQPSLNDDLQSWLKSLAALSPGLPIVIGLPKPNLHPPPSL